MHRPSFFNFSQILKSFLVAAVMLATLCVPTRLIFAAPCTGTDTNGNDTPAGCTSTTTTTTNSATNSSTNSSTAPQTTSLPWADAALSKLAGLATWGSGVVGNFIIAALSVIIPVMGYQGFTSSLVVGAGWAIVRDVVNMFFVVVLIVIAMGTIFGVDSFKWKQQVPALMVMAIVINFSKTLCGLMIDFSQVIMLTFANALKDIAGGNFIQLLGLTPMMSPSKNVGTTVVSFDLFAAAATGLFMMLWVLSIVLMLLIVLVYRVVMLWILIVMAPLAWFTKVVPIDMVKGTFGEWMSSFVCYCAVGPVLTFFLWLTLAVAGAGSIAADDPGLSAAGLGANTNATGGISQIFELNHLASFVIGIALLMAGLDAAQKVCAHAKKPGGFDKALGQMKGGGFITRAVQGDKSALGGSAMRYVGGKTKAAGLAMGGFVANEAMEKTGIKGGVASALRSTSNAVGGMNIPIVSGWAQEKLGGMAGKVDKSSEKQGKEAAKGLVEGDQQTQMDYLKNIAGRGKLPMLDTEKNKAMAVYQDAVKDKEKRKAMEANGSFAKLQEMFEPMMKAAPAGSEAKKSLKEINRTRPDLGTEAQVKENIEKISKENIGEVDAASFNSEDFRAKAATIQTDRVKSTQKDKDGNETYTYYNELEAAHNGWRGQEKKKILEDKLGPVPPPPTKSAVPAVASAPVVSPSTRPTRTPEQEAAETKAAEDLENEQKSQPTWAEQQRAAKANESATPSAGAPAGGTPAEGSAPVVGATGAAGAEGKAGAAGAGGVGGAGGAGGDGGKGGRGGSGGVGMPGLAPAAPIPGSPSAEPTGAAPRSASKPAAQSSQAPKRPAPGRTPPADKAPTPPAPGPGQGP